MTAPAISIQEIRPPSARAEAWWVGRAAFHLIFWSALAVSAQRYDPSRPAGATQIPPSPFERRFADLDGADQRLFRGIQEGVGEAERRRSATGRWPGVEVLAAEGIPPFAADPIDRAGYAWTFAQSTTRVNYLGTPAAGSGRPAFLVIVAEPEPGAPVDPQAAADEVHHRLGDGAMIHVTVWMGPGLAKRDAAVSVVAPDEGWKQILVGPAR